MAWRVAKSLVVLRNEVNAAAPHRSKASDGTLGDPAHAARASRHNPNNAGVVCALDVTHDPGNGVDIHAFARRHVLNPHPDLEYIISNGQVARRSNGWTWTRYTGASPHTQHAHFAVGSGPDSEPRPPYDTEAPWGFSNDPQEDDMPTADEVATAVINKLNTQGTANGLLSAGATLVEGVNLGRANFNLLQAISKKVDANADLDEQEIAALVLAGLDPAAIAAAIPSDLAEKVADELRDRLAS